MIDNYSECLKLLQVGSSLKKFYLETKLVELYEINSALEQFKHKLGPQTGFRKKFKKQMLREIKFGQEKNKRLRSCVKNLLKEVE